MPYVNSLPTFFMAEKFPNEMKLKALRQDLPWQLGTSSVKSAFRRNLEPQYRAWYGGLAPSGNFRSPSANSDPARPHYGPKDFAWISRTFEPFKSQLWGCRARFGANSGRNREEGLTL